MWLNILLFFWVLHSFQTKESKKGIALKIPIVVLKYAAWGTLIYFMLKIPGLDGLFFVFGLCSWVFSLLISAILLSVTNKV